MNHWHPLIPFVPLLAMLCWAAASDVRSRLIRNWLTASLLVTGLLQSACGGAAATVTPGQALLGWLAGFGLLVVPFAIGAVGGGDVKLLAGIGAWVGPTLVLQIFMAEAVVGLGVVLAQAAAAGKLRALFRNSAVLAVNLAHADTLGVAHCEEAGRRYTSIDRPLPYAVPTLVATVLVLWVAASGGR
jgi:prepilin peptidase CpaA